MECNLGMLIKRSNYFFDREIVLPTHPIQSIVTFACPVQTEETSQAVDTELSLQDFQRMSLELFVGHLL